jgi:hypothetical protein
MKYAAIIPIPPIGAAELAYAISQPGSVTRVTGDLIGQSLPYRKFDAPQQKPSRASLVGGRGRFMDASAI